MNIRHIQFETDDETIERLARNLRMAKLFSAIFSTCFWLQTLALVAIACAASKPMQGWAVGCAIIGVAIVAITHFIQVHYASIVSQREDSDEK